MNRDRSVVSWPEFYRNRPTCEARIAEMGNRHLFFLNRIIEQRCPIAIEVGIGTGVLGFTLKQRAMTLENPIQVIELDKYESMVRSAIDSLGPVNGLNFLTANTFSMPMSAEGREGRVIFHQGLLEHFEDPEIHNMLRAQLKIAATVVASVPSDTFNFSTGLRGDERLMSLPQWEQILQPFRCVGECYGENENEAYHICLIIKD